MCDGGGGWGVHIRILQKCVCMHICAWMKKKEKDDKSKTWSCRER